MRICLSLTAFLSLFFVISIVWHLLSPRLIRNRVHVSAVVFVSVGIHFSILTEEGPLVECVLIWHVSRLRDLVQLSVEQVAGGGGVTVFLTTEYKNLRLRHWTSAEPVLNVILKALRPDFNQLPVWLLITGIRIKALNIRD